MRLFKKISSESGPVQFAIYSFIGATVLFLLCATIALQTDVMVLVVLGVFTLIFINFITALVLLFRIISFYSLRKKSMYELLLILANGPIAALYIFIIYNQKQLF